MAAVLTAVRARVPHEHSLPRLVCKLLGVPAVAVSLLSVHAA
jgi:hypothetical protein